MSFSTPNHSPNGKILDDHMLQPGAMIGFVVSGWGVVLTGRLDEHALGPVWLVLRSLPCSTILAHDSSFCLCFDSHTQGFT